MRLGGRPQPGPQAWPAPPGGMQLPPAGPDPTRVDGLGPVLPDDLPTAMLGDLRLAPASGGPRRSGRRMVPVIVAVVLVVIVAGFVIFRGHPGSTASGTTGTTPSASPPDARRQAAVRLSGLLAQSVTDRAAVIDAPRACAAAARPCARTRRPSPVQPAPGSVCCPGSGACPAVPCCLPRCCRT